MTTSIEEKIKKDSEKEVESIMSEVKKQADGILKEAKTEINEKQAKLLSKGGQEAKLEKQRRISEATIKVKRQKGETKESLIQKVLDRSRNKLASVKPSDKRYQKALNKLALDGAAEVRGGTELLVRKDDRKILDMAGIEEAAGKVSVKAGTEAGVVIQNESGMRIDNTLSEMLSRREDSLRTLIAKTLFK